MLDNSNAQVNLVSVQLDGSTKLKKKDAKGFWFSPYPLHWIFRYLINLFTNGWWSKKNNLQPSPSSGIIKYDSSSVANKTISFSLSFIGDLMLTNKEASPTCSDGFKEILKNTDVLIANVEAPLIKLDKPDTTVNLGFGKKSFLMSTRALSNTLTNMGVSPENNKVILSGANNHAGDQLQAGVRNTKKAIESIGAVPAGISDNDKPRITIIEKDGVKIGVVAWTEVMNNARRNQSLNIMRTSDVLGFDWAKYKVKNNIQALIGFPHWDFEQSFWPMEDTQILAKKCVDLGFDVLVGHGPHVVQPTEQILTENGNKGVVCYSLGNYCSERGRSQTKVGSLLNLTIEIDVDANSSKNKTLSKINYENHFFKQIKKNKESSIHISLFNGKNDSDYPEIGARIEDEIKGKKVILEKKPTVKKSPINEGYVKDVIFTKGHKSGPNPDQVIKFSDENRKLENPAPSKSSKKKESLKF